MANDQALSLSTVGPLALALVLGQLTLHPPVPVEAGMGPALPRGPLQPWALAMLSTGEQFICWVDRSWAPQLWWRVRSAGGAFLSPPVRQDDAPFAVASGSSSLGGRFLIAEGFGPKVRLVSPSGAPLTAPIEVGTTAVSRVSVASDGDRYLVSWCDGTTIRTRVVSASGVPFGPEAALATEPVSALFSTSAAAGGDYLVAWNNFANDIFASVVTPTGAVGVPRTGVDVGPLPRVAWSVAPAPAGGWLVAWLDQTGSFFPGYFYLTPTLSLARTQVLPSTRSLFVDLAYMGPTTAALFTDWPSGNLRLEKIAATGLLLADAGVTLGVPASLNMALVSATAATQSAALLFEDPNRQVRQTRLDATGASLDGTGAFPVQYDVRQSRPSVAAGEAGFLVVWEETPLTGRTQIRARLLSRLGQPVLGALTVAQSATQPLLMPEAVAVGPNYLVTWVEGSTLQLGTLLLDGATLMTVASNAPFGRFDDREYGLCADRNQAYVWSDEAPASWRRFSDAGTLVDTADLPVPLIPAGMWTPRSFTCTASAPGISVAWQLRDDLTYRFRPMLARASPGGTFVSPLATAVGQPSTSGDRPGLAHVGGGKTLLSWFADATPYLRVASVVGSEVSERALSSLPVSSGYVQRLVGSGRVAWLLVGNTNAPPALMPLTAERDGPVQLLTHDFVNRDRLALALGPSAGVVAYAREDAGATDLWVQSFSAASLNSACALDWECMSGVCDAQRCAPFDGGEGPITDAGQPDSGAPDSGATDGGSASDGGVLPDGGLLPDSGTLPDGGAIPPADLSVRCGCGLSTDSVALTLWAWLCLGRLRRPRWRPALRGRVGQRAQELGPLLEVERFPTGEPRRRET